MNFFFGTQGNLKSVKIPTTGLDRVSTAYRTSGVLTNGGGFARASVSKHYVYNMNWDFIRNDEYAQIRELFDSNDLIHFLDPQAAVTNSLPSYIAQAGEAALGGYRLVGYTGTTGIAEASTLGPEVTTGPKRTAAYTGLTGATRKQIWLPIPTGYTLWLRGLSSGTCNIALSGGVNVAVDPLLRTSSLSAQGATYTDSRPISLGPNGTGYYRRTIITANTTSPMYMALGSTGTAGIPVVPGQVWTGSHYARKSPTGGPATRMDVNWYDAAGATLSNGTGGGNSVTASWSRYTQTYTVPAGAAYMRMGLLWTGTALAGQTLDLADVQVELSSSATAFSAGFLASYPGGGVIPQVSIPSNTAQGTYLSITAGDDITLRWLQAKVLPTGQAPDWTAGWQPGLGHSGCRLDGDPSYVLYSAPQAIDYGALNLVLRETGAWE